MRLDRIYVRFFRSFNFDFQRRAKVRARRYDWEMIDGSWYPHIRLDVDTSVTAIVGANESGKSHLLDAIECVLGQREISRSDFCRYSQLFSVETGTVRYPDFGGIFTPSTERESEALAEIGVACSPGNDFLFMRPGTGNPFIIVDGATVEVVGGSLAILESVMPKALRYSTSVAIPDSIPIRLLWGDRLGRLSNRQHRNHFLQQAEEAAKEEDDSLWSSLRSWLTSRTVPAEEPAQIDGHPTPNELAKKILLDLGRVDPTIFQQLQSAVISGAEGEVSGLESKINSSLARHLNFSRWWSQDEHFKLRVTTRERELVFTIGDRTGTEYSFAERSRGLTHFLAYFVQMQARVPDADRSEILLMDEPDAYLSNSGQQDLLRLLESFARPDDGSRSDQVLYVTHSPFLINKNAATRIRVLDKGSDEDGTRVVKDVVRTHYEPLRSSLGSYVAETAFIGGKNLIVEGVADQVLLAGVSNTLRRRGSSAKLLDLNETTIIPAGSADSIPYIAYLARGRDPMKPPCVALLDGDQPGIDAEKKLARSEQNRKQILASKYVVRLDRWAQDRTDLSQTRAEHGSKVLEIEDLIPLRVAVAAARCYLIRNLSYSTDRANEITEADLKERLKASTAPLWDVLRDHVLATNGERLEKVGFAREVVHLIEAIPLTGSRPSGYAALMQNFEALLTTLAQTLNAADIEEKNRRRDKRMGRIVRQFLDDFATGSSKATADLRLQEIESTLDDSAAHDQFRLAIAALRREFKLGINPNEQIPSFEDFRVRLEGLTQQERLESMEIDDDNLGEHY